MRIKQLFALLATAAATRGEVHRERTCSNQVRRITSITELLKRDEKDLPFGTFGRKGLW